MPGAKNKQKLSKRLLDSLKPINGKRHRVWDTDVQNFHVVVQLSGQLTFAVKYRLHGEQRTYTIGPYGQWDIENARMRAREVLLSVAKGVDPTPSEDGPKDRIRVMELCDRYLKDGPIDRPDKRQSSWDNDAGYFKNHVKPLIGRRFVDELKPSDMSKLQSDVMNGKSAKPAIKGNRGRGVRGGRGAACHTIRSLSAALGWAVEKEWISENPCSKIKKITDGKRDRYLSGDEKERLIDAILKLHEEGELSQQQLDLMNLIAITGVRRGELFALTWPEVDLANLRLVLSPARHKTGGANKLKSIPIGRDGAAILGRIATENKKRSEWVFPSRRSESGHVEAVRHSWEKIKTRSSITDMTVHDFRHAYASFAINSGAPLAHIGANLGHAKISTTERYAHLQDNVGRPVVNSVEGQYSRLARRE